MPISPNIISTEEEEDKSSSSSNTDASEQEVKPRGKGISRKMIYMILIFILLVILTVMILTINKNKDKVVQDSVVVEEFDPTPTSDPTADISLGEPVQNTIPIESNNFVRDFNNGEVNEYYSVSSFRYEVDFVSYTMHRQSPDGGIELFYLDAIYKGKSVIIPINYSTMIGLDPVGITVVEVEIASVFDANFNIVDIITGFVVKPELKDQIVQGGGSEF